MDGDAEEKLAESVAGAMVHLQGLFLEVTSDHFFVDMVLILLLVMLLVFDDGDNLESWEPPHSAVVVGSKFHHRLLFLCSGGLMLFL